MAVRIITIFVQTSVFWRHRGSFVLPGFAGTWARSLHPLVSSYGARLRMMKSATPKGCKTVHATSGSLTAWAHWRLFDALSINISRCWLPVRCACWQTHYNNEKWKIRKVWLSLQEERRQFTAVESGSTRSPGWYCKGSTEHHQSAEADLRNQGSTVWQCPGSQEGCRRCNGESGDSFVGRFPY